MRVVHVDLGKGKRGGQYQMLALAAALGERGVDNRILGPHGEPFSWSALREPADLIHAHDAHAHTRAAIAAKSPLVVSRRVAFPVKTASLRYTSPSPATLPINSSPPACRPQKSKSFPMAFRNFPPPRIPAA
jgi:hypothetical protein